MGFFSDLLRPTADPRPDLDADAIWEKIERANLPRCRISEEAALLLRQKLAADLGRSLGTTPLPGDINGTVIEVDDELPGITVEACA